MERSEFSTIGLRRHVWSEVNLVPLSCEGMYGAKWILYHWLAKARMERSGFSTAGLRRHVWSDVDLVPLACEGTYGAKWT